MVELRGYIDEKGNQPFARWFSDLDYNAAARVQGNLSNVKGVGGGIFEYKIDFGPGYRIYFGKDGDRLVILVGGGSKKRQARDIAVAHERWADYKRRKKQEMY
jgi:putative addiction module killer protein